MNIRGLTTSSDFSSTYNLVHLFSRWLVKALEIVDTMLNTLQLLNIYVVVTAVAALLWIEPIYLAIATTTATVKPTPPKTWSCLKNLQGKERS